MKIFRTIFSGLFTVLMAAPTLALAGSPSYSWTPEEMSAYADIAQTKCLNIVVGDDQNILYNGEVIEATDVNNPFLQDAKVAADKMGYLKMYWEKTTEGQLTHHDLIVDGAVIDSLVQTQAQTVISRSWTLGGQHTAYTKPVYSNGNNNPKTHLFFDGEDWGEVMAGTQPKIFGNAVFYQKSVDGEYHYFMNKKDLGKDVINYGYDGKTLALIKKIKNKYWLYVNGKAKKQLVVNKNRPAPGLPGSLVVENGKVIYSQGADYAPQIYLDGTLVGTGYYPHLVNDKVLYVKAKKENETGFPSMMYGKKAIGHSSISADVAGKHWAFVDWNKEGTEKSVHIDGQIIPSPATYVHITQKPGCKE